LYNCAGVDNVIGTIDGTLVPIKAPKCDPEVYVRRKCNHAITLQAMCDPKLKFADCFVGYPGSVSDTRIFRNSDLYNSVNNAQHQYFPHEEFIIGDKAYPNLSCVFHHMYIDRGNLRMNWRNIVKWRKLLKTGTIVLSSMLKYCAKLKKNGGGILKLLPFKVSGYFTRVLMRNRSMLLYKLIKNIFQNGQFCFNFSNIKYRYRRIF
jgi:hypothetical protein